MDTKVVELDLNDVLPNRFQPRIKFNEESIQELANSIKDIGVIQPIVVKPLADKYEIIAGERRYKASILAGKKTIPAIITDLNEKDSAEVALIENVQRKDLTPIEEAISYKKMLDMGYLTQDTLATKLGKQQSTIANKLRLLNLDDDVQEALLNEKISERHARSLLKIPDYENQRKMLKRIIEERLTVRKTDEEIDKMIGENNINNNFENNNIQPTQPIKQPQESTETFNFDNQINNLNIPNEPIIGDTTYKDVANTTFNPQPEIINSSINAIQNPTFNDQLSQPVFTQTNINNNQPAQNISTPNSTNEDLNTFNFENLINPPASERGIVTQPNNQTVEEKPEDILVPGKFFNIMADEDEKETQTSVQPTVDTNPFNFNLDINNLNNVETTNNLPNLESIDQSIQALNNQPQSEINMPTIDSLNSVPNSNPTSFATQSIPDNTFNFPNINNNINNNINPQPPVALNNLKDAINAIRELSTKLSNQGFIIDIEEFDFENMYQIIFKINK